MRNDKLITTLLEMQKLDIQFKERIANALHAINDNNILHKKAIDTNTDATNKMTTAFEVQTAYLKAQSNYIRWITITLVLALIVLAGAEKTLEFIPRLYGP